MRLTKRMTPAVALAASLIALPAVADTWQCKFKPSKGNATPEEVIIQYDASSGATQVLDGIVQHYVGHAVEARSVRNTASTFSVRYDLPSVKDNKGQWIPGIVYSIYIEKGSGKARITGRPSGNYREVRSTGSCKRK